MNTKQISEDEFLELIRTRSEVKEATPSKKDVRTSASKKGRAATTPSRKTKTTTTTTPQRDTEPSTPSSTNIGSSPATPSATVGVSTPTPLQNGTICINNNMVYIILDSKFDVGGQIQTNKY